MLILQVNIHLFFILKKYMTSEIVYTGNLRTVATHIHSKSTIETDAPVDNKGKGERFSPTDLVATALGSCIVTTLAIKAEDMKLPFENTTINVTKVMSTDAPRRIVAIQLIINFPHHCKPTTEQKQQIERIAHACPVHKSLHPDIKLDITFNW